MIIGDRDRVVLTDAAVFFCTTLSAQTAAAGVPSQVALHVLSEPRGHAMPPGGQLLAAAWILKVLEGLSDDDAFARALGCD